MKSVPAKEKGELIARLLAGSWRAHRSKRVSLTEEQLEAVSEMLCSSGAGGLAWWAIRHSELKSTSSAHLLSQTFKLQALQAAVHTERISRVFRMLRQADVEPLLVKGWVAAALYPDLGLRPFGDIDLLIRPREFETARAVLNVEATGDCLVDLHLRFSELKGRSIDDLFARSRLLALERGQVRVLAAEDHLALQAIHLLKHGAWRPLWLCDVAAAIESLPDGFNWKVCLGSDQLRRSWIQATLGLAKQLLGADCAKLPFSTIRVPRWMEKSVLKQWGSLWPANHLPIQPPPLMAATLNGRSGLLKATLQRWPDPITATFKMNGAFTAFPRLPYQLGEFTSRAGRFLLRRPKTVLSSS